MRSNRAISVILLLARKFKFRLEVKTAILQKKVEKIRESLLTFLLKIIIQYGEFLCLKCSKSVMITWCPNKFWFGKIDENHKSWKIRESLFTFLINKNIPSIFWSKRSKNVSITRCPNKFCTWQKNLKKIVKVCLHSA